MENLTIPYLDNEEFLRAISRSFDAFLKKGTSRSTNKLRPLHGAIASDLANRLGGDYEVWSKGYRYDREAQISGRYVDKWVDITVKKGGISICGIAVKFVMQNYSQNSNNYFENMLGETANIRCNKCPYFQIFIILDKLPYYNRKKEIVKWESFSDHNMAKYVALSNDNVEVFLHTPNKTLIYVVHLPDVPAIVNTASNYMEYYRANNHQISLSARNYDSFGRAVILNDYECFIDKVYHTVKAL